MNKHILEILDLLELYKTWESVQGGSHPRVMKFREEIIKKWNVLDKLLIDYWNRENANYIRGAIRRRLYQKGIATNSSEEVR